MTFVAPIPRIITPPLNPGLVSGGIDFTYVFRDLFTTDDSSPLDLPRNAEPGPGVWTNSAGGNSLSISGGALIGNTNGLIVWSNSTITPTTGYALSHATYWTSGFFETDWGLSDNSPPINNDNMFIWARVSSPYTAWTCAIRLTSWAQNFYLTTTTPSDEALYFVVVIDDVVEDGVQLVYWKSSSSVPWRLNCVWNNRGGDITKPLTLFLSDNTRFTSYFNQVVEDIGGVFSTPGGACVDKDLGDIDNGATLNLTSGHNWIIWYVRTRPSSGSSDFRFKIQDASNYWQIKIYSNGDIELNEVVAGTPTQRGISAGAITNGSVIHMYLTYGGYIRAMKKDGSSLFTHSGASNFWTETTCQMVSDGTGGDMEDLLIYPMYATNLTPDIEARLDAMISEE